MALTDLQRLRLKIADRPSVVLNEQIGAGDGATTKFKTQLAPVVSESETVTVNGAEQTRDTDYSIDDGTGVITFDGAPASEAAIKVSYQWTTFSDEELNDLLDQKGSIVGAAIEAIGWLLADTDRLISYTYGQEKVDRKDVRRALNDLLDRLEKEARSRPGMMGVILADTDEREDLMEPWIDQDEDTLDVS
jgi:hypothetical protein